MPPHHAAVIVAKSLLQEELPRIGINITMVKPLTKPHIVKKRTKPFKRHQCDRKISVKVNLWHVNGVTQRCNWDVA